MVNLSRAEQWVLHHVMLDVIDSTGDCPSESGPDVARCVLEKLEEGEFRFTRAELDYVRRASRNHAMTTESAADRNLSSAVSARIEASLEAHETPRGS